MSRMALRLFAFTSVCFVPAVSGPAAMAQETYGPVRPGDEAEADATPAQTRPARQCETEAQQDGVILVCRELDEEEAYRSPLPAPTASDRTIIPGLTDPPCWVTNPSAVGTLACMRVGWAPPPALIVDLTQFPEPLDEDEAAVVSEIPGEAEDTLPPSGERIPIDLADD